MVDLINEDIFAKTVRLVTDDGSSVITRDEAMKMARMAGLDLVMVAESDPPVCKILDFGKYRFEKSKRDRAEKAKARQSEVHVREIQLRPVTDDNDIRVKASKAREFIDDGDKVKIKVKFRGREVTHSEKGREVINALITQIGCEVQYESPIVLAGRDMITIIKRK